MLQCCAAAGASAGNHHGDRRLRSNSRTARRQRPRSFGTALLDVRMGPGGADALARDGGRRQVLLQESAQPLRADDLRQVGRRRRGSVRARDAPLRQAGVAHRLDADWRRARAGACCERVGAAVLPAAPLRAPVRARAAAAAAARFDRGADVGPLRHAPARHGRGVPAQPRRLHHRLGGRAHGADRRRPFRSRRLHRLFDQHFAQARRRVPRDRGLPAGGAGASPRSRAWRPRTIPTFRTR